MHLRTSLAIFSYANDDSSTHRLSNLLPLEVIFLEFPLAFLIYIYSQQ